MIPPKTNETPRQRKASISPSQDRNQPTGKTSSPCQSKGKGGHHCPSRSNNPQPLFPWPCEEPDATIALNSPPRTDQPLSPSLLDGHKHVPRYQHPPGYSSPPRPLRLHAALEFETPTREAEERLPPTSSQSPYIHAPSLARLYYSPRPQAPRHRHHQQAHGHHDGGNPTRRNPPHLFAPTQVAKAKATADHHHHHPPRFPHGPRLRNPNPKQSQRRKQNETRRPR